MIRNSLSYVDQAVTGFRDAHPGGSESRQTLVGSERGGVGMKPMSELVGDLAARVKKLEDLAAAARERNRAVLQARRQELEGAIDSEVKQFEATATEVTTAAGSWWADTKASIERQVVAIQADIEQRKVGHKKERAERMAELAEEGASGGIALAAYCLTAAEWAVVDAALARAEAEELART